MTWDRAVRKPGTGWREAWAEGPRRKEGAVPSAQSKENSDGRQESSLERGEFWRDIGSPQSQESSEGRQWSSQKLGDSNWSQDRRQSQVSYNREHGLSPEPEELWWGTWAILTIRHGYNFFLFLLNSVLERFDSTQLMTHNRFTRIDSNQLTIQNVFLKFDLNRLTGKNPEYFDSNQLKSQKTFQNFDLNRLMT